MKCHFPLSFVTLSRRKAILRSFAAALNSQTVRIAAAIIMTLVTIAFLGKQPATAALLYTLSPADWPSL